MSTADSKAYPHLHPDAAVLVDTPLEQRLEYLEKPYYIPYPASDQVLGNLRRMMITPRVPRMVCALIMADSNNGKSSLLRQFLKANATLVDPNLLATVQPVVTILAPASGEESRLYLAVLKATNAPVPKSTPVRSLQGQVETVLAAIGTRMIVIDEFQHFSEGTFKQQRVCLAALKNLHTSLRISLVGSGTKAAIESIRHDPQLENRFVPWELPRWTDTPEFASLLRAMVSRVPLKEESKIFTKPILRSIIVRTGGLIGEVRSLILMAGYWALSNDKPHLDAASLDACGYRGPAERTA